MDDNLLSLSDKLDKIVERHRISLSKNIEKRRHEMELDNIEHLKLYELLGFSEEEGRKVDLYQNIGRFVYKYAGSLIEEATVAVLQYTKPGKSLRIPNTISNNPKTFRLSG